MRKKHILKIIFSALGIAALILDSKTAVDAAANGISLCIQTVIPSLFPFCFLSILLTSAMNGMVIPALHPLRTLCHMPKGTEGLFIIGLLGGYPTGAQAVSECYRQGQISKDCAARLIGFCNNAGPAFIFGIMGSLFHSRFVPGILLTIHILSAVITGILIPGECEMAVRNTRRDGISMRSAFKTALFAIASVCGWIVLFRVLVGFLERWFLWFLPETVSIAIIGLLELANGAFALQNLDSESLRFLFCSFFLSFGGFCVGMQTISVTAGLETAWYFTGKIIQTVISLALASIVTYILIEPLPFLLPIAFVGLFIILVIGLYLRKNKITVAFSHNWVYNTPKQTKELR